MPSQIVAQALRRIQPRQMVPPPGTVPGDGDHEAGHPHLEMDHEGMDRQHSFESAMLGLKSLAKENMPGAGEMVKMLEKYWASWQGQPQGPSTMQSHRASPVTRTDMDTADEQSSMQPEPIPDQGAPNA